MTNQRVLAEGADSLIVGSHVEWMKRAGYHVVLMDISNDATGKYLVDDFEVVPKYGSPGLEDQLWEIVERHGITMVIPSVDEGLLFWASIRKAWAEKNVHVLVSPPDIIDICSDKLKTHKFLTKHGFPSPKTKTYWSLGTPLKKPRKGRGSQGVEYFPDEPSESKQNDDVIWQELLTGPEYTVDVLCTAPGQVHYCVIRERLMTKVGLSTKGRVVEHPEIERTARNVAKKAEFFGPINIQFIEAGYDQDKEKRFAITDINPRISGGQALTLDATENWFDLYPRIFAGEVLNPRPVTIGRAMSRCFKNIFHE